MILPDVNILVHAYRKDMPDHARIRDWLAAEIGSEAPFGIADLVLSGFVRVVSHPGIFRQPTDPEHALEAAARLRDRPNAIRVEPGPRHWGIFDRLCRESGARGGLVADAWYAALAIEAGCEWITLDRDFARFPGLRWRAPG